MSDTTDIIDRIDELVDDQLAGGEPRQGYDYGDPNFPQCWRCGRHWHGLKITERIALMYAIGRYDETYSAAEDDSPVVCPGSDFIGPIPERHPRIYCPRPVPQPMLEEAMHAAVDALGSALLNFYIPTEEGE